MKLIITGNVLEGFKFYGPIQDDDLTMGALDHFSNVFDLNPEWALAELEPIEIPVEAKPRYGAPQFVVKQVNTEDKWTVLRYDGDECKGGDHHWLSPALAYAAKRTYEKFPSMHGALPSEIEELFKTLFGLGMWPSYKDKVTS